MIAAPIAGAITDRVRSASKLMSYSFILYSISFFIMLIFARGNITFTIISLIIICLFVNMGKSMALVTLDEIRMPPQVYGLSINLISFCAYSPDAFYYSLSGKILDIFPDQGYHYVFLISALVSLLGLVFSRLLLRSNKTSPAHIR